MIRRASSRTCSTTAPSPSPSGPATGGSTATATCSPIPHVGLIFLIPGRGDTLRINGRARLVRDAPFFDAMVVKGHRPILALVVEVEEVFHHCAKAFLRSRLWQPETWSDPLPPRPVIAKTFERQDQTLAEVERHYGPQYEQQLYG